MVPDIPLRRGMGRYHKDTEASLSALWFTPALPTGFLPSLSALLVVEMQRFSLQMKHRYKSDAKEGIADKICSSGGFCGLFNFINVSHMVQAVLLTICSFYTVYWERWTQK